MWARNYRIVRFLLDTRSMWARSYWTVRFLLHTCPIELHEGLPSMSIAWMTRPIALAERTFPHYPYPLGTIKTREYPVVITGFVNLEEVLY